MTRDHVVNACKSVYSLFAHSADLRHVAAYDGYVVAYVDSDPGPPWEPVMEMDGVPVYFQRSGSIPGVKPR